ncbi:MAG TPA: hypothetical protein VMB23_00235, partial [Spirochaetia bacterium]|nr:hypothetical protein [Spirochaetia bacterium]
MRSPGLSSLVEALDSPRPQDRTGLLEDFAAGASAAELWAAIGALHQRGFDPAGSPYLKVRALLQAAALCRYHLPPQLPAGRPGRVPFDVVELLRDTRYVDALNRVRSLVGESLPDDALVSVLATAYAGHGFQVLALQVQTCVRMVDGNRWMFRLGAARDYPLRFRPELLVADPATGL